MKTDITIILDRSGSMESIATDTIGGFNKFLKDQQEVPGEADLSLIQFDHEFINVHEGRNIKEVSPLNDSTYVPRGNTALLDAIGRGIVQTGQRLSAKPSDKVVFVIITDGLENASTEYSNTKIHEMIEHQKSKYSWEFVFLGANQNAFTTGRGLGVSAANCMTYASNKEGTEGIIGATSNNLRSFRVGASKSMAYSMADKEAQLKAGVKPEDLK